jgi:hypothetical protein
VAAASATLTELDLAAAGAAAWFREAVVWLLCAGEAVVGADVVDGTPVVAAGTAVDCSGAAVVEAGVAVVGGEVGLAGTAVVAVAGSVLGGTVVLVGAVAGMFVVAGGGGGGGGGANSGSGMKGAPPNAKLAASADGSRTSRHSRAPPLGVAHTFAPGAHIGSDGDASSCVPRCATAAGHVAAAKADTHRSNGAAAASHANPLAPTGRARPAHAAKIWMLSFAAATQPSVGRVTPAGSSGAGVGVGT